MNPSSDNLFHFDGETAELQHSQQAPHVEVAHLDDGSVAQAMVASNTVTYHWNIQSDEIAWSSNASETFGCSIESMSTGRKFALLLSTDNFTSRYDTVMRSATRAPQTKGESFEIEYQFKPEGRYAQRSIWIEDRGRWLADANGTPTDVYGAMQIADARHVREQELNFLSSCDALTGMMNRGRMMDVLDEAIRNAQSEKTTCALAIVAVNNLDIMNEAYGFEVADELIVALAERLRRVMRVGDSIARYSGSKFGIILNGCKPNELTPALERFMRSVRDSVIETRHGPVWALLSIGAVSLPALGETASLAAARAEEALSEAFRLPADGYVIYNSSEERQAQRLLNARCATEIVGCLRDGLFKLAYQPVVDAKTGQVAFHEALLRMADTTGAIITAGHLVPIAERLGLIRLIDRAVLQQALATLLAYPQARLSINISGTTANDPRWNQQLLDILAEVPELASRLIVEITETAALGDLKHSRDFVCALRALGCGIAIDDFGAGFTSYRNLKELPITLIKLDGHFCHNLRQEKSNLLYIKSMVELAHAFGLAVVAEWVESPEDAEILSANRVDFVQGNLLGEPSIDLPWSTDDAGTRFEISDVEHAPDHAEAVVHETLNVAAEVTLEASAEPFEPEVVVPAHVDGIDTASDDIDTSLDLLKSILAEFQHALEKPTANAVQEPAKALAS